MIDNFFPPSAGPPYRRGPEREDQNGPLVRIARVKLLANWHSCGSASANLLAWFTSTVDDTEAGQVSEQTAPGDATCRDPAGMIEWELAAQQDDTGSWYIPAGAYCTVWQPEDAFDGHWELLHVGDVCTGSDSGSHGSGSGSHCVTPADRRLDGLPGYNPAHKQALIHDENDCLMWLDIEPC
jgi:hypothetical protein